MHIIGLIVILVALVFVVRDNFLSPICPNCKIRTKFSHSINYVEMVCGYNVYRCPKCKREFKDYED